MNDAMLKKFHSYSDKKVFLIPTNINLDCENNFPAAAEAINEGNTEMIMRQNNGVHPAPAGYRQIGDTYYAWLKHQLSK